jgi:lipopolysaccharide export system protein LptA
MRFDGQAAVWQEEVAVWGDSIVIDPDAGAVRVAGSARSSVRSDTDASTGAADVIRYDDATRRLVLLTAPEEGAGGAVERATGALARLTAGGGEIRARRVEVGLAADSLQTERIDALGDVTVDVDRRRATGARLSYVAAEARYLMRGDAQTPVLLVESCSEITGNTLTFFKGADRIVVDGDSGGRSRTRTDGSCAPAGAR